MKTVEKQFGPPTTKHPTVGKPPITRWDYAGFSVFFEGDRVIDSVRDRRYAGRAQPQAVTAPAPGKLPRPALRHDL